MYSVLQTNYQDAMKSSVLWARQINDPIEQVLMITIDPNTSLTHLRGVMKRLEAFAKNGFRRNFD